MSKEITELREFLRIKNKQESERFAIDVQGIFALHPIVDMISTDELYILFKSDKKSIKLFYSEYINARCFASDMYIEVNGFKFFFTDLEVTLCLGLTVH